MNNSHTNYEDEGNATPDEDIPSLSTVEKTKIDSDGSLIVTLYNEQIDILSKLKQFGIAYTNAGKVVLKVIDTIHEVFGSLHKKGSGIDLALEMKTIIADPDDPMSKVLDFKSEYKIQNTKTKTIFSIKFDSNNPKIFNVSAEKIAFLGDKANENEIRLLEPKIITFSQKSMKKKCEEIFGLYTDCDKNDNVDEIADKIAFNI